MLVLLCCCVAVTFQTEHHFMSFSPSRHSQNWAVRTTKIRPFLIRNNYRLNYNFRLNVLRMSNLFSPLPSLYLAIYLKLTTGIYNTNPRGKFLPQQLETSKTDINLMQQHRPPLWNFREKNIFFRWIEFFILLRWNYINKMIYPISITYISSRILNLHETLHWL